MGETLSRNLELEHAQSKTHHYHYKTNKLFCTLSPETNSYPIGQIKYDERTIRTIKINRSAPRYANFTP